MELLNCKYCLFFYFNFLFCVVFFLIIRGNVGVISIDLDVTGHETVLEMLNRSCEFESVCYSCNQVWFDILF